MTKGEVRKSPLVFQASELVAKAILEVEKLREERSASVYPQGIGNVSVSIRVADEAVEVKIGSPECAPVIAHVAKHTMTLTYTLKPEPTDVDPPATAQFGGVSANSITLIADGKSHQLVITV